jgi:ketosteroid isomerase-like protein
VPGSRTNVDVAREMIELVNRADDDGLAALMAPDVQCFPDRNGPDPPFRGREAFLRYARGWTEAFEHYAVESCEYLDYGEYVIVIGRTVARGRGSGVETSSEGDTWLCRFRDLEVVEYHECDSLQEALDAVGASSP